MSKGNNIRWRKEDSKKIANVVRIFNSKLTRVIKKNPSFAEFLPERITTQEVKDRIGTRKDFNREINSLLRFMKKGAEMPFLSASGIKTTEWEKKEIGYKVAVINRKRTMERKKADVSTYKGTMGTIESNNLKPKVYNINAIKPSMWDKFKKATDNQTRDNYESEKALKYKENYLKSVIENLGDGVLPSSGLVRELYDLVSGLNADEIYNAYYDDPVLQINFTSDPLPVNEIAEGAIDHWTRWMESKEV